MATQDTPSSHIKNYGIGAGGVNLVKNPLQLDPSEGTQFQNAEWVRDSARGGDGALSKRGGLAALTSALAGSILGLLPVGLKTTYTRTLYAARGTEDSNTFMRSTNGTSWTDTSSPLAPADSDKFTDANGTRDARRIASFKNFLVYPGNGYTKGTDKPTIVLWDGTDALTVTTIGFGPSATADTPAYAITDFLVANGKIYIAIHDPGGSGANLAGRVLSVDLITGEVSQVASSFGNGTGEMTGGYPSCLAWYQGKLWVGLNSNTTTDGNGKIVNCYPDIDTTWTADVSNLRQSISTLCVFKGDLYAGTQSSVSNGATITQRSASTGTWTTRATSGGGAGGSGHYASMIVHGSALYAVEYFSGGTDILHIVTSSDGTSWSTSRDVDANDSPADPPQFPSGIQEYDSKLYVVFRATTASATDGFIMQLSSGTWTKVATDNFGGPLAVLVERA